MGLDVSHGCWGGAYSRLSRWRTALADVAGYWVLPFPNLSAGETVDPRLRGVIIR